MQFSSIAADINSRYNSKSPLIFHIQVDMGDMGERIIEKQDGPNMINHLYEWTRGGGISNYKNRLGHHFSLMAGGGLR